MPARRTAIHGRVPLALQVLTLSNSTVGAVNATTRTATVLHLSVETQAARYSMMGNVARTTGVLLAVGDHWIEGYNGTSLLQFQRSTGTSKVTIQPYKYEA